MKSTINVSKYIFLILLLLCCISNISHAKNTDLQQAQKGRLDLQNWNFEKNGIVKLNGEWEFYWQQLLEPHDFKSPTSINKTGYINFPDYWNGYLVDKQQVDGIGYVTYRLLLKMPKTTNDYVLSIKEMLSAYKLFLNGKEIAHNGKVAKNCNDMIPNYYPITVPIQLDSAENELVLQVSNNHHRLGGVFNEIELGTYQQITHNKSVIIAYDLFLFGCLFIMALYHFVLFMLRRKDRSTLFFGICSLLIALRVLTTGEQFLSVLLPSLSWELSYKLDYFTFYLGPPVLITFFYLLFPREFSKKVLRVIQIIGVGFTIFMFATPAIIYSYTATYYQVYIGFTIMYAVYSLIKSIKHKRDGAFILFIGVCIFFIAVLNDILYMMSLIKTTEISPLGLLVFIFSQSLVLSMRFSHAFVKNEELTETLNYQNKNLEQIVVQRTAEISQQKEEILTQSEQLFEANLQLEKLSIVARETDNAVAIFGDKFELEWVNTGFTKLYGYTMSEFIELKGKNIFNNCSNSEFNKLFDECVKNQKSIIYESTHNTKNNKIIWVQTTLTPIINTLGTIEKLVAIDTDVSQMKNLENFKELLTHMIVHDLKNPLNSVICISDLHRDDEEFRLINIAGVQMLNMVSNILDIQKFESNSVKLTLTQNRINETIQSAITDVKPLLDVVYENSITVNNLCTSTYNATFDDDMIHRVLVNLFTNAIKYTPRGGKITIDCIETQEPENKEIKISVSDTGIGIPKEWQEKIFDKYLQVEAKKSGIAHSTGLGLTFCKLVIEAHGCKIGVISEMEKGTTFWFTLKST